MAADDGKPYDVGFGRPPKATRFKKGQSGNPSGRPPGAKNFKTVIAQELNARITVTENGRQRKLQKREVVAKRLVNKAAEGDPRAMSILLDEAKTFEDEGTGGLNLEALQQPEDELVVANLVKRIRQVETPKETPSPAEPEVPPAGKEPGKP